MRETYKRSGEYNPNSKLNWNVVTKMRWEHEKEKKTQKEIAERYEVNQSTVSRILKYKTWRREENAEEFRPDENDVDFRRHDWGSISTKQVDAIRWAFRNGISVAELARANRVSSVDIERVLRGIDNGVSTHSFPPSSN